MLLLLSFVMCAFGHDPGSPMSEVRLTKADNCRPEVYAVTVPAESMVKLRFVTDPTDRFWASFNRAGTLDFRPVSGFEGHPKNFEPMFSIPEIPGNIWFRWSEPDAVEESRIFVVKVKNPTETPVNFLVSSGITRESLGFMFGDPADCLR